MRAVTKNNISSWSIKHPIGVTMCALAVIVLGSFSLVRLSIDLLPSIVYPEIRVRVVDSGVPAAIMEDSVTRQLEEQLAITENVTSVRSFSSRGASQVDLAFDYSNNIDSALRDASTRLDRAKRFLPDSIDPPVIFKLDPSQIPVMEMVVSSSLKNGVELRSWSDDVFSKWFLNLPGVSSVEVGGGLLREVQVVLNQDKLAALGLSYNDVSKTIKNANKDSAIGRIDMPNSQITARISGRFYSIDELKRLPVLTSENEPQASNTVYLGDIADIVDSHEEEKLKVRVDGINGIRLSIQKQPTANTTNVVSVVKERLTWLKQQNIIPEDTEVTVISDQAVYIKTALNNASLAAISGAFLAMSVVYLFLGNMRHTLIIGSAIPIAIFFTCVLMGAGGLTLNIMTLGGLALGIGMLVDNTIVMLENIARHQTEQPSASKESASVAASEVTSAIVASTSTNLSAVFPFLFIGGLIGVLFNELIFTISAAIFASMVVALTIVPAYAASRSQVQKNVISKPMEYILSVLQSGYAVVLSKLFTVRWLILLIFLGALGSTYPIFTSGKQIFLPKLDTGRIRVRVSADAGTSLDMMDKQVQLIEDIISQQPETQTVSTIVGGSIFGRTQRQTPTRSTIVVQLQPLSEHKVSSDEWIDRVEKIIKSEQIAGFRIRLSSRGIRGIRTGGGDDDIRLILQGDNLQQLKSLADDIRSKVRGLDGLRGVYHTLQNEQFEMSVSLNRERASELGINVADIAETTRVALQGKVVSDFIQDGRSYDIRLRFPVYTVSKLEDLQSLVLTPESDSRPAVYLGDIADIKLIYTPLTIRRENQMRVVEIGATLTGELTLGEVLSSLESVRNDISLPEGYTLSDGGADQALKKQNRTTFMLLGLALFLVFVVMAIQYESLLNPAIIMLTIPFVATGVALGVEVFHLPLSMPMWLGMIMLVGIVVNNAILLVEYIELEREKQQGFGDAIIQAATIRLRPILMTTMSTVVGMLPLAVGFGDGSEMLQPLAVTVVFGLTYSLCISLLLLPVIYYIFHSFKRKRQ
ncbi:MAG: efflux RND transporter permease subunit [Cellvibrionaceae bacterium]